MPVCHQVTVRRFRCSSCSHTHALFLRVLVPYSSYSLRFILLVPRNFFLGRACIQSIYKHAKQVSVRVQKLLEKREESYQNIQSEKGIAYRINRSIQVGGVFGVLKNNYGFQRFLLRGKKKVKLEIFLMSIGYNLNKLHRKIQNERTES